MIDRKEIERLGRIRTEKGVVSVSVKIDPRLGYERGQPAMKFKGAYARAARRADAGDLAVIEREHDRVLDFLKDYAPRGRGVIIYASTPDDIWEVYPLDVMVPSQVSVGSSPNTALLAQVMEEYPRMAVLMLDGGDARIYSAEQGSDSESDRESTELPNRHAQGGWAQARYERHVEFHHAMHLKSVAEKLEGMYHERPFDRLVIVGAERAAKEFEALLPEDIRRRLIGNLTADFKQEGDSEILDRARALREEDERASELVLVNRIFEQTDAKGRGALGIDETIEALIEGRVDTLVVAEGVTKEGTVCLKCDYFAAHSFSQCPACAQSDVERLPDAIEHAIEYAIGNGSHVNIAFADARAKLLSRGGIGALLRYAEPSTGDES
ncbi:MAG: hypothetical protein DRI30_06095 [Chloroflexi bacterium]|nr:MAG: hypothetical protein DRI30_06095 [Chloroflexota bacterium]